MPLQRPAKKSSWLTVVNTTKNLGTFTVAELCEELNWIPRNHIVQHISYMLRIKMVERIARGSYKVK